MLIINFSASNDSQGYKSSQDYGQYFETNYWHRYSMWNQPFGPKTVVKPDVVAETPKTNGNLSLIGKS